MAELTIFLAGDVMTGRGIDQVLPSPGDPALRERLVRDARGYVALAESVNGPIPWPVPVSWPWGDVLTVLEEAQPDVRIINLETSVTTSGDFAPGKPVHYRMHPDNVECLVVARPDVCALANNHVLDFGQSGLVETLRTLDDAGLAHTGAGRNVGRRSARPWSRSGPAGWSCTRSGPSPAACRPGGRPPSTAAAWPSSRTCQHPVPTRSRPGCGAPHARVTSWWCRCTRARTGGTA